MKRFLNVRHLLLGATALACAGLMLAQAGEAERPKSVTQYLAAAAGSGQAQKPGGDAQVVMEKAAPTFYSDGPTFDAAFPGLPIEDFEEYGGVIDACSEPIDENSNDLCFSPGDIIPGLAVQTFEQVSDPSVSMVAIAPSAGLHPSVVAGSNFFVDTTNVVPNQEVCALGMMLHGFLQQSETWNVEVTTTAGTFNTTALASLGGSFFGVSTAGEAILSVRLISPSGDAEEIDNVRLGVDTCSGACCTDEPGVASDCIETSQDACEAENGLFVGGSCDDVEDCLPLFVAFDSVSVTKTRAGALIEWVTSTEIDTVGFRVLREEGGRTKAISQVGGMVPAAGIGLQGGSYSILDREGGDAVRYWIVDIDVQGRETRHGPFLVERSTGSRGMRGRP